MKKQLMILLSLLIAFGSIQATGQASGPEAAERENGESNHVIAQNDSVGMSFDRVQDALRELKLTVKEFAGDKQGAPTQSGASFDEEDDDRDILEALKERQTKYNGSLGRRAKIVDVSALEGEVPVSELPEPPTGIPVTPPGFNGMRYGLAACGTIVAFAALYELVQWASVTRARHDMNIITTMMNPRSEFSVDQFDQLAQGLLVVSDTDKGAMRQLVEENKIEDLNVYAENVLKSLENTHNSIGILARLHYGATNRLNQVRSVCSSAAHTTKGWFEKTKRFFIPKPHATDTQA